MAMQFWGAEAKANNVCKVPVEPGSIIHLSQVILGDTKKVNETVVVHVTVAKQKLVLAMLSQKTPQLTFDLVFDEDFEISHNWKNGSIHLMGYQSEAPVDFGSDFNSSDEEEEDVPVAKENGQFGAPVAKAASAKPSVDKTPRPEETDDSDEDDSDEDDDDSEDVESGDEPDQVMTDGDTGSEDDGDEDDSDESEDEPVKVPESGKKRSNAADVKTPQSKKAKIATPQKTDGNKKGAVHPATPHPNKKGGKTPGGDKTPKSAGSGSDVSCGPCKKTFKSETALQSHAKAKHGAK